MQVNPLEVSLLYFKVLANTSSIIQFVHTSLTPILNVIFSIGSLMAVFFLIVGAYQYISSSGDPSRLAHAKKIIVNSLIGLVIVIAALFINNFLINTSHINSSSVSSGHVPSLVSIKPKSSGNPLIDIILKAISGVLANIITTIGSPFLKALSFFISQTPLVIHNSAVFHLWVISVALGDGLLVLVIALIGLKIMSFSVFGFNEISIKQVLPQLLLAFILMNSSIFIIDYLITVSNIMIKAIASQSVITNFWDVLQRILTQTSGYSLAVLLIMVVFLILSIILIIFYVGRLVSIYLGAVLAPLVVLSALIPGFRDFAISAAKKYIILIFLLFIHVVIIELAASLLAQLITTSPTYTPDPLMSAVLGLATIIALLKTQGVLSQLATASVAPKMARMLSQKALFNVAYVGHEINRAISGAIPLINGGSFHSNSAYRQTNFKPQSTNNYPKKD